MPKNDSINDNERSAEDNDPSNGAASADPDAEARSGSGPAARRTKKQGRSLSAEDLRALNLGRQRSRWIDEYIKALDVHKWENRGARGPTPDEVKRQLAELEERLPETEGVKRVIALQERANLIAKLEAIEGSGEFAKMEERFISVVKQFSTERKISYDIWRQIGVPFRTLAKAGMYPSRAQRGGVTDDSPDGLEDSDELEDSPKDQNPQKDQN